MKPSIALAVLTGLAASSLLAPSEARADFHAPRPFVLMVRGFQQDPNAGGPLGMQPVRAYLAGRATPNDPASPWLKSEVWSVTWNCLHDGAVQSDCAPNDYQFLEDAGALLDEMPHGRPVVLIGHSFGGDSLLKAVGGAAGISARVHRPVTALVTIDPVGTAGRRATVDGFYGGVPSSVGMYFNRWQRNTPYPFNFLDSGLLSPCAAAVCDQAEQSFVRAADGSVVQEPYGWVCGPTPWGMQCSPPLGFKDKKSDHGSLVSDEWIDAQIIARLGQAFRKRPVVALRSAITGSYVRSWNGGGSSVDGLAGAVDAWESYELVDLDGGDLKSGDAVRFVTWTGHYLCSDENYDLVANRPAGQSWETFRIHRPGGGTIASGDQVFITDFEGLNIAAAPSGALSATSACGPNDCTFTLEAAGGNTKTM